MTRDNESHSVVMPLMGAGALGAGAYGSYRLDNHLADLGISKGLTLNREAVKAINEFANATPEQMRDPSRFIFRYSDLGNKASKAQLFNEDPRKAYEWFTDTKRLRKGLTQDLRRMERGLDKFRGSTADFVKGRLGKIIGDERATRLKDFLVNTKLLDLQTDVGAFRRSFTDVGAKVRMQRLAKSKLHAAMAAAHETEIGKSQTRALTRLMNEWADVSKVNANDLVRHTTDALYYDVTKSINPRTGKPFRNAAEYLTAYLPGSEKTMRPYLKLFEDINSGSYSSRKEVLNAVKKRLFPATFLSDADLDSVKLKGKNPFQKELLKNLGRTTKYEYSPDVDKLTRTGRFRRRPGVTGVKSIRSIIRKSPALTFMASDLGQGYRGKEFGQMIKALRVGQTLRNPKLRLALGLGSAGLGGLGITNLVRNIRSKND